MRHSSFAPFRWFVVCAVSWLLVASFVSAQSVTEAEASVLMRQGKLASTAATAGVPLVFDRDGQLLTAKQFNALIDDMTDDNAWDAEQYKDFWTDFTTYQEVLRKAHKLGLQSQARVNLVKDTRYVVPPLDPKYKGPYLFDPFQKFYKTWEETEKSIERKTRQQSP